MARKELANWLKQALLHANRMPQAELARRLTRQLRREIDRAAVQKMTIAKRDVAGDEMLAIAEITGFPIPEAAPIRQPSARHALVEVPLLSWISAGKLASASADIPVEDVPLLAFADLGRGDFFALRVQGDSMDRVSPDGSVIVVDRKDQRLVAGKFYVFAVKGDTTYKAWRPGDPDYLAPFSFNPANQPIFFRKRDLAVVGRVRRTLLDL